MIEAKEIECARSQRCDLPEAEVRTNKLNNPRLRRMQCQTVLAKSPWQHLLRYADDAVLIDSSALTPKEVIAKMIQVVRGREKTGL